MNPLSGGSMPLNGEIGSDHPMMEDPHNIPRCIDYVMIARYLERCADHACDTTGERVVVK
ncbi:hypothetical protein [Methanoculleus nereidis]|jgi:hypothetical protein|uniref:hypothetical protein n=1 Tax=Methanoculleus nereidis TaxID=2735141 RepID=UPI0026CBE2AC